MAADRSSNFDIIILGAGAAGLMCAMSAGARGRRVLLLDHADRPGKKILISGGGRCNFTNLGCTADRFLSGNRHFAKSALARYTQHDFIALIDKHWIAWHEKTLGQLFCDGSARQVVEMLVAECEAVGVDLRCSHRISNVEKPDRYRVSTDHGVFESDSLVLATGGPSIPKMGATAFSHDVAKRFGLPLKNVRPALVPFTLGADDLALMQPLSGVALECVASIGKTAFREAMLLTHRGMSGPAILQISSYWREGEEVALNLLPDTDAALSLLSAKRDRAKAEPKTILAGMLPSRLAAAVAEAYVPRCPMADLPDKKLRELGEKLNRWRLTPSGTEGYAKAEVTLGGVDTASLSSQTMEAKTVPGLFVIGEAVDVTGWLGGYNFQWAWSSGWVAGQTA